MKKSVVWAMMAMLSAMTGCVKIEDNGCDRECQELVEIPFTLSCDGFDVKGMDPSSSDESKINWVDIFVSVSGEDYCRHRVIPGETSVIAVKKGASYLLGAVANAYSETWDVKKLTAESGGKTFFRPGLCRLSENCSGSFVMMTDEFQTYTEGTVHFELKRRVSKCTVRSIKNMWGTPARFEVKEIYLAGVLEYCRNDASVPLQWYNETGYEPSAMDHLLYSKVGKVVSYGEVLETDASMYYLPVHESRNFVVVNVLADEVPMSYSFRLPDTREYNKHYVYDLVISHSGDEDMIPDYTGSIKVNEITGTFEVADWDETTESRGF